MWVFEEGSFVPCAKIKNGKTYSIITDHLGTPTQIYNAEGESVWEQELDMYGNVRKFANKDYVHLPFRYQGQYYDKEINLCYNRFRYYDPEVGRYISEDPIGFLFGEFNLYNYVDDCNSWVDIFGLAGKIYVVYQAIDLDTGKIYTGRTSGSDDLSVEQILNKRKSGHHRNLGQLKEVFVTDNYKAVRGGEQYHIEEMRKKGMATDQINGIGPRNKKADSYMEAFKAENNKKKTSYG